MGRLYNTCHTMIDVHCRSQRVFAFNLKSVKEVGCSPHRIWLGPTLSLPPPREKFNLTAITKLVPSRTKSCDTSNAKYMLVCKTNE